MCGKELGGVDEAGETHLTAAHQSRAGANPDLRRD